MTDDQRQEIMRCQAEGMRAWRARHMEEMTHRLVAADGARQRGTLTSGHQEAMRNFWGATADAQNNIIPNPPPPTLWARFMRWIRAERRIMRLATTKKG